MPDLQTSHPQASPPTSPEQTLTTSGYEQSGHINTGLPPQQESPSPSPQGYPGTGYNNPLLQGQSFQGHQGTQGIQGTLTPQQLMEQAFNQPSPGVAPQGYSNNSMVQQGRAQVEQGSSSPFHPNMLSDFPSQGQPLGGQQNVYQNVRPEQNYTQNINSGWQQNSAQINQAQNLEAKLRADLSQLSPAQLSELRARGYNIEQFLAPSVQPTPQGQQFPFGANSYAPQGGQGFVPDLNGLPSYNTQGVVQAPQGYQSPSPYLPQEVPQQVPQQVPQDYVDQYHIDELVNRNLGKVSTDGYASAETIVRQFGLPIEHAAELINESHVRLEDWAMDLYGQAKELAHLNVALQNQATGHLEALNQQDELLQVYAAQMIDHQNFMKELIPHVKRYEAMEALLLDSEKLREYWNNLKAVEAEYGTHQEHEAMKAAQQEQYNKLLFYCADEFMKQGIAQEDALRLAQEYIAQRQQEGQVIQGNQGQQPARNQIAIPQNLPYQPGEILSQVDPSQLTPEQVQAVKQMTPEQLAELEYRMAVEMGVITVDGQPIQSEPGQVQGSNVANGYRQYVGEMPTPRPIAANAIPPNMPAEARAGLAISEGQAPQQAQTTPVRRQNYYEHLMNGGMPLSVDETNRRMAEGQYEATRPQYQIPRNLTEDSLNAIRPTMPVANHRSGEINYPMLDQVSPQQRFILLDKLEREGIFGQQRTRLF